MRSELTTVLVGNDVVDLASPEARSTGRPGFVERVCSRDEALRVRASAHPEVVLWQLFAAKEAAYKVLAKLAPGTRFAHRLFEVADDLAVVRHGDVRLALAIETTPERVHAVASTAARVDLSGVGSLASGESSSAGARRALVRAVAARLGCSFTDLAVHREPRPGSWDGYGPPVLLYRGVLLDLDVSLSHDGPYVAFAAGGPALSRLAGSYCAESRWRSLATRSSSLC